MLLIKTLDVTCIISSTRINPIGKTQPTCLNFKNQVISRRFFLWSKNYEM